MGFVKKVDLQFGMADWTQFNNTAYKALTAYRGNFVQSTLKSGHINESSNPPIITDWCSRIFELDKDISDSLGLGASVPVVLSFHDDTRQI